MDLFKPPKDELRHEEKVREVSKTINSQKHYKRFGTKKPIDKFVAKKASWREDL